MERTRRVTLRRSSGIAPVAQRIEHPPPKRGAAGSIPAGRANIGHKSQVVGRQSTAGSAAVPSPGSPRHTIALAVAHHIEPPPVLAARAGFAAVAATPFSNGHSDPPL